MENSNEEKTVQLIKCNNKIANLNKHIERFPTVLEKEDECLISIIFTTFDQKFNFSVICKNTHTVEKILKEKLYQEYPKYKNRKYYFVCNAVRINISKKFKENQIKDGNIITIYKIEDE